jgi:ABC-type spermidine/putrescine transport system permease subunit II
VSAVELQAVASSFATGAWVATCVSLIAAVLAYPAARAVPTAILVGLALVSSQARAFGVLALGLPPGTSAHVVALASGAVPLAALVVRLRLDRRPRRWLEAAADLGASPAWRFRLVEWPHLRPAFAVAMAWVAIVSLGDTTVATLAGGGLSYGPGLLGADALLRESAPGRATAVVVLLLVIALALCTVVARELRHRRPGQRDRSGAIPPALVVLGWTAVVISLTPVLGLFRWLGGAATERSEALVTELVPQTIFIAVLVAAAAGLGGFAIAFATRDRSSTVAPVLLLLPVALPPGVLGMLMLLLARAVGLQPGDLLTVLALLPSAVALGYLAARLQLSSVPSHLWDAASDLGARPWTVARLVAWPITRVAALAGALIAAAWAVGEPAIVAFTSGPGGSTLSVGLAIVSRAGDIGTLARWELGTAVLPVAAAGLLGVAGRIRRRGA